MPHSSGHHNRANVYADSPTALLDRGLDLSAEDIALKSIADTHAVHASQPTPSHDANLSEDPDSLKDREGETPRSRVSETTRNTVPETPRIAALTAQLPSEGLQTLFDCCSRISSILLSLSSAVHDTAASSTTDRKGSKSAPAAGTGMPAQADTTTQPSPADDQAHPDEPPPSAAPAGSGTGDEGSSMHDASGTTDTPPSPGRTAHMKKMAEQFLSDRDRGSGHTSAQQGGALLARCSSCQ